MERRTFLQMAAWLGTAGTLTAPALAAAKEAVKTADPTRLNNFLGLSTFLLGLPLPGIEKLDPTLNALFLSKLDSFLSDQDGFANQNQQEWGTAGFDIPPQPDGLVLTPATMDRLLQTWQETAASGEDIKTLVDTKIFAVADLSTLAQKIIAIWYTGLINNIPGQASVYAESYIWGISHAHQGSVPHSFGYWQHDPVKAATSSIDSTINNAINKETKS